LKIVEFENLKFFVNNHFSNFSNFSNYQINIMKNAEIQKLSLDELKTTLVSETDALARLKFAHAVSPIENPLRIREARKVVARLQTAISAAK
jgi:large subunit ribosomal protein L29